MNAEIYEEAIQCNTEEELHEYARKNLNRDFTELEIKALMKVIRVRIETRKITKGESK